MLVMFLSLAPRKEEKGKRAGEAMVVRVVMLRCCWNSLERRILLWFRLLECMSHRLNYSFQVGCLPQRWSRQTGMERMLIRICRGMLMVEEERRLKMGERAEGWRVVVEAG